VTERDRNTRAEVQENAQEGAQQWLGTLENLAQQIQKQQQVSQQMTQELMNTYMQLLNTPGSYLSGQAEQQQQTFQQVAQQWMQQAQQQQQTFRQQAQQQQQAFQQMVQESLNSYAQLFNIPASYAQQSLRTAQKGITEVPIPGYDELTVEEASRRLDELDAEELRRVRDYEKRNRNRDTLIEQIDRKIDAAS
jgi:CRP-like cAMP-binding protein